MDTPLQPDMWITFNAIGLCTDIPDCRTAEVREATLAYENVSALTELKLHSCASTKTEVKKEMQSFWSFRDTIVIIGRIAMKGRRIIIPTSLQ